jgi:Lipopolysaccharide-assembly
MSRRASVSVLQLTLVCLFAFGCAGYHVGPVTKRNFNSIAVPVFRNTTLRPQIEAQISNAIIQRLQQDGSLRIESEPRADVVLKGSITKYNRQALRSLRTDTGVPREYELTITVRVEATDRRTGETVLRLTEVEGKSDVFIGEDQQSAEEQALPLIADDIGKRVAGLLVESWQ